MVVFSPVAQQPSSGIEDRLQAIQEILRRSDQQTVISIDRLDPWLPGVITAKTDKSVLRAKGLM